MNHSRWVCYLVWLMMVSGTSIAWAEDDTEDHIEASWIVHARMYSLFAYSPAPQKQDSALIVERLRPQLELNLGESLSLKSAWDVLPLVGTVGSQTSGFAIQGRSALRLVDFERVLIDPSSGDWQLQHNLDRVELAFFSNAFEVRLGRQAMSHGSARLFPATDVFGPFGPGTIDTEFKRGIDALRLTIPIQSLHELEIYTVANTTNVRDWMMMARWRSSFEGVMDLSTYAGVSYRRPTLGLDLSGDVKGAAWYVDAFTRLALEDEDDHTVRVTAGLDYQWSFGLRTVLEAHYNSLGSSPEFLDVLSNPSIERQIGEVFFLGQWYMGTSLGYALTPLLNGSLNYIQSLTDASGLFSIALGYDYAQEVSLGLGALVPVGKRPSEIAPGVFVPKSEFGLYPIMGFTDVRLVF